MVDTIGMVILCSLCATQVARLDKRINAVGRFAVDSVEYSYELLQNAVDTGLAAYAATGYYWAALELTAYRWANSLLLNAEYEDSAYGQ